VAIDAIDLVINASVGGAAILISQGISYLKSRSESKLKANQQEKDNVKSETEQALAMYKGLIDGLKADINEMDKHLQKLEDDHLSCRVENATLRANLASLTPK
jgi:uncharacterized membrane-anchored protein YhcB (DUF1043 family)